MTEPETDEMNAGLPATCQEADGAREALALHWGESGLLTPLAGYTDATFRVDLAGGGTLILKVSPADADPREIESEAAVLRRIASGGRGGAFPLR